MAHYDLVVVGGGIFGAGVAQAAAADGHSVLLLERHAIAHGTSSRSTKLIHGGLRYLESGQLSLVYECLQERQLLCRIAPDLVRLEPFHIPVYRDTSRSRLALRSGLSLYALLAGLGHGSRYHALPRPQWDGLDGLTTHGLKAVYRYYDGRTDDAALTRAVLHSAQELGTEVAVPAEMLAAEATAAGVEVSYREGGEVRRCRALVLVNAAGPWVGELLQRIEPAVQVVPFELVQGTHLVLDGMSLQHNFYLEAPQDRRAVFLLPWRGRVLLGTTEIPFNGDPEGVVPLQEERDYLLAVLQHYFPRGEEARVVDAFAGLRVLPAGGGMAFGRPREMVLQRSHPRVFSIYGGKLTSYRREALRVMRQLRPLLPRRVVRGDTASLLLSPD